MITAPSYFVIDRLKQHGFFQDTGTVTARLPNTIDLNDFQYFERNYDEINILYVGRLVVPKGPQVLIEAVRQLNYKNIRLHIVGTGEGATHRRVD